MLKSVFNPIYVEGHRRKLPECQHFSLQKQVESENLGISLTDGEDIVDSYERNITYMKEILLKEIKKNKVYQFYDGLYSFY